MVVGLLCGATYSTRSRGGWRGALVGVRGDVGGQTGTAGFEGGAAATRRLVGYLLRWSSTLISRFAATIAVAPIAK